MLVLLVFAEILQAEILPIIRTVGDGKLLLAKGKNIKQINYSAWCGIGVYITPGFIGAC